jgi:hypothetical protein
VSSVFGSALVGALKQCLLTGKGPLRWVQSAFGAIPGKLNPLVTVPWESFTKNEDWRGAAIRNPSDPMVQQTKDGFGHLLRSLMLFSVENATKARRRGAPARYLVEHQALTTTSTKIGTAS